MFNQPMDEAQSDFSFDEGRYVRLPLKALWVVLAICSGITWGYFDLRTQVEDTKKATASTALTVKEDHQTLMEMHDNILKLGDFADESKRLYNRYFRDYNDPDRKSN